MNTFLAFGGSGITSGNTQGEDIKQRSPSALFNQLHTPSNISSANQTPSIIRRQLASHRQLATN